VTSPSNTPYGKFSFQFGGIRDLPYGRADTLCKGRGLVELSPKNGVRTGKMVFELEVSAAPQRMGLWLNHLTN
jgi:hypothetical protein